MQPATSVTAFSAFRSGRRGSSRETAPSSTSESRSPAHSVTVASGALCSQLGGGVRRPPPELRIHAVCGGGSRRQARTGRGAQRREDELAQLQRAAAAVHGLPESPSDDGETRRRRRCCCRGSGWGLGVGAAAAAAAAY
jgi:hypothetical protein